MDETYINVKGKWKYYYRTVEKYGNVIDFSLCDHRDEKAARAFFNKSIGHNGLPPEKVVIDKSGANALSQRPSTPIQFQRLCTSCTF